MIKSLQYLSIALLLTFFSSSLSAQTVLGGEVHGSFEIDGQLYKSDNSLGITSETLNGKKAGFNGFGNLTYTLGNFTAGMRYEAFLPPLNGFSNNYEGSGIANWYADYKNDLLQITVGNFYEQFGSGLTLRSYEEWALGYDNSLRGLRLKLTPFKGVTIKALVGYHREYWKEYTANSRGLVKGADVEFSLNDLIPSFSESKTRITIGGSIVSKYEKPINKTLVIPGDTIIYKYDFPSNVAMGAGRININHGGWNFMSEYAYKANDPNATNNYIYKAGQALYSTLSWSTKGFGIMGGFKRIDNMGFKSRMTETGQILDINFLPPLTKMHQYSFAMMYPFASQPNGEMALQGQVDFTIPKNSLLGGKYGTQITLNYSRVTNIDKQQVDDATAIDQTGTLGYKSDFFAFGGELYYSDLSVMIGKKLNHSLKGTLGVMLQEYNKNVMEGHKDEYDNVKSTIIIGDVTWRLNNRHALRFENQWLFTKQDKGNWVAGTIEYTVSPNWFFAVQDEYNYGINDVSSDHSSTEGELEKIHYYNLSAGFIKGNSRIAVSYGRQREGLLCVGGVCRQVPAATGFTLTLTTSF